MKKKLFTKSAFKQALFCPASLYYYYDSDQYANQMNEDDFLQALADGGNQVGDLAKVYYNIQPEADLKELKDYDKAIEATKELFKRDEVIIAEAAFRWEDCFVRADIIEKKGNIINLIEVKAKSWADGESFLGTRNPYKNTIKSGIREYVYDVSFQKYVVENALGKEYTVNAFLMMADKNAVSNAPEGVNRFFRISKIKKDDGSDKAEVIREAGAESLLNYTRVLKAFPVDKEYKKILEGTDEQDYLLKGRDSFEVFIEEMSRLYVNHEQYISDINDNCFKCPFYSNDRTLGKRDGKLECWMKQTKYNLTETSIKEPMVGDLWCGLMNNNPPFKRILLDRGKLFLSDIKEQDIPESTRKKSGLLPSERRCLQIGLSTNNTSMLAPFQANLHNNIYIDISGLSKEMKDSWHYPLHMIDFETSAVALPFFNNMSPYEPIAFQFSHHIIDKNGRVKHYNQFLNVNKEECPNFDFVRELRRKLVSDDGTTINGTIFRYADHENTILRAIRKQLQNSNVEDKDTLVAFIESITHPTNNETGSPGPWDMIDLRDIILRYYYHPDMKGSNSIKAVLPAILNSSKAIQEKYSKPIYGSEIPSYNYKKENPKTWITHDSEGKIENPYKHLDSIADIAKFLGVTSEKLQQFDSDQEDEEFEYNNESIANGGAALAAYTKLQFADEKLTPALKEALLRYCELDTMSMVFIWEYFHEMTGI